MIDRLRIVGSIKVLQRERGETVVNDDVTNKRSERTQNAREPNGVPEMKQFSTYTPPPAIRQIGSFVDVDGSTTFFRLPPASRRDATAGLATT